MFLTNSHTHPFPLRLRFVLAALPPYPSHLQIQVRVRGLAHYHLHRWCQTTSLRSRLHGINNLHLLMYDPPTCLLESKAIATGRGGRAATHPSKSSTRRYTIVRDDVRFDPGLRQWIGDEDLAGVEEGCLPKLLNQGRGQRIGWSLVQCIACTPAMRVPIGRSHRVQLRFLEEGIIWFALFLHQLTPSEISVPYSLKGRRVPRAKVYYGLCSWNYP